MLAVLLLVLVLAATSAGVAARAIAHSEAVRGRSGGDAARAGADATVASIWANWDPVARAADSVGTSTRMLATGDSVVIEAHVIRTSPRLWWVTAQSCLCQIQPILCALAFLRCMVQQNRQCVQLRIAAR